MAARSWGSRLSWSAIGRVWTTSAVPANGLRTPAASLLAGRRTGGGAGGRRASGGGHSRRPAAPRRDCGRRRPRTRCPPAAGRSAARPSRCSRAGQSAQPIAALSAEAGTVQRVLVAQHGDGERRHSAPGGGRAGAERAARARPLRRGSAACLADDGVPLAAPRQPGAPTSWAISPMRPASLRRVKLGDQRRAALGDAGFFGGDVGHAVAEQLLVVEAEAGDRRRPAARSMTLVASSRPPSPTSRMQASAGVAGEGEEGGGGGRFEEARLDAVARVEHFARAGRRARHPRSAFRRCGCVR